MFTISEFWFYKSLFMIYDWRVMIHDLRVMILWFYVCLAICCVATSLRLIWLMSSKHNKTTKNKQKNFSWSKKLLLATRRKQNKNMYICTYVHMEWITMYMWVCCAEWNESVCYTYEWIVINVWMHCYQSMNALLPTNECTVILNALLSTYECIVIIMWMRCYPGMNELL